MSSIIELSNRLVSTADNIGRFVWLLGITVGLLVLLLKISFYSCLKKRERNREGITKAKHKERRTHKVRKSVIRVYFLKIIENAKLKADYLIN